MTNRGKNEPRAALACRDARVLLMGYIDGELSPGDRARLEDHLAVCIACRADEADYRRLGAASDQVGVRTPADLIAGWEAIHDRLTRRAGWALMWLGLTVLFGYGAWQLLAHLLLDPSAPLPVRIGVGSLAAGLLLVGVNVIRERFYRHRTERYREVQR